MPNKLEKIEVKEARTLANELVKNSETKPGLKRVDVPDKLQLNVTVTQWEKVWAVFDGWLNTKVKDAAEGKRVELPGFREISTLKWALMGGVLLFLVALLLKIF